MNFKIAITQAAEEFKKHKAETIGIISHNDTDGITSAAIMAKALQRQGTRFQIHFITKSERNINELIGKRKYKVWFLLDYGSQEVIKLSKELSDTNFFILDHHPPASTDTLSNIVHINPHLFGINGVSEACGATISYLFARALDEKNKDLAPLALVGAIGDFQRKDGIFKGPNQEILEQAMKEGYVNLEKGLRFYGWGSRPIHKALEYSTDPFIPGISGSESTAVQFLQELNINLKKPDQSWKTLKDLPDDEKKKLATAIIAKRHNIENPADIFEDKVILTKFEIEDLREAELFSLVLNSCAKLAYFGLATSVALGNKKDYEEAKKIVQTYRKQIIDAMNYFFDNRKNPEIVKETENAIYFFGGNKVNANLSSTVSTILSVNLDAWAEQSSARPQKTKNGFFREKGKAIFVFGKINGNLKVSARYVGSKDLKNKSLSKFCSDIAKTFGGEGGGHHVAAGATIPAGKEEMFINAFEEFVNNG